MEMKMRFFAMLLVTVAHLHDGCHCLRISRLDVPTSIAKGSSLTMGCQFDLQNSQLYSVKWYLNMVEFYRYLPSDMPTPGQKFKLRGAYVGLGKSNVTHVHLYRTDLDSGGTYACEVSNKQFITVRAQSQMKVYVLPNTSLEIVPHDDGKYYDVGQTVNLTCISGAAYPRLNLTWYINDRKATGREVITYPTERLPADGLKVARLGLLFRAARAHFRAGPMRLECSAALILSYKFATHATILNGQYTMRYGRGAKGWLHRQGQPEDESPLIGNGKDRYAVGDILDINCTAKSHHVQLNWFLNDRPVEPQHIVVYPAPHPSRLHLVPQYLGVRFTLTKEHFQVSELKLDCVATHNRNIAEFKDRVTVQTHNAKVIGAQLSKGGHLNGNGIAASKSGLNGLQRATLCLIIMWYFGNHLDTPYIQ